MDQLTSLIVLIIAVVVVMAAGFRVWSRHRHSKELREGFGSEYPRAVAQHGDQKKAESELEARRERVQQFEIRSLTQAEYDQFSAQWTDVQARFVDGPNGALYDADRLVQDLLRTRGYPVGDFEQRAADISVDHPRVVEQYRAAQQALASSGEGAADTEELRQAMVYYRALFDELLEPPSGARSAA